jgi:integrase
VAHIENRGKARWRARYIDPSGRERSRTFRRKAEAENFLTTVENGKLRGDWIDPSLGRLSLRDFWTGFVEPGLADRLRPTTLDLYGGLWARFIEPNLGGRQLASVNRLDVENFVGRLVAADVGAASIGATTRLLHRIFQAALRSRRIAANPVAGVERPALPHNEMRFLTAEEVQRLVEVTPEQWRTFVLLSAWCGLRFGEISSLTVRRVDLVRRQLRVEETLSEVSGILHKGPPKTKAKRSVAIPAFLCGLLEEHMRRWPPGAEGRIFSSPRGGPVRRSNFRNRVWQPTVEKAGLSPLRFTIFATQRSHWPSRPGPTPRLSRRGSVTRRFR